MVDDDDSVLATIQMVLQQEYTVLATGKAQEAVQLITRGHVDAAVLDLRLPDISGHELHQRLRDRDPLLEVVFLTGQGTLESAREAMRAGACDYLSKPFHMNELKDAVQHAVWRRRQNERFREIEHQFQMRRLEEEADRLKNEIYSTVLHDLNSPLTAATGMLELLKMDFDDAAAGGTFPFQSAREMAVDASAQLNFCTRIVDRYLSFMRQSRDKNPHTELAAVFTDLRQLLRMNPSIRTNELVIHAPPTGSAVAINGMDLLQILLNLTINAFQASEQSHQVTVTAEILNEPVNWDRLERSTAGFSVLRDNLAPSVPVASITVSDNGPGIPPELIPRIFETFFTTKTGSQGTGLGLAIVKRLLEENRGALFLQSSLETGSAFTVFLPASP